MIQPLKAHNVRVCTHLDRDCGSSRLRLSAAALDALGTTFGSAVCVRLADLSEHLTSAWAFHMVPAAATSAPAMQLTALFVRV